MTAATTGLVAAMLAMGKTTWLEAFSFVTGAACVWLTVKESAWNFPISLINVSAFSVVFFKSQLYADAGLQVAFFILTLIGWYLWLYGGERRTALHIVRTRMAEGVCVILGIAAFTGILWPILLHFKGSAMFWDALTTSISLGAQWLLNRKRLETWIAWIVVDVIYIPLYLSQGLYLTAILYVVFLGMAITGLRAWHATWVRQRAAGAPAEEPVEAAA